MELNASQIAKKFAVFYGTRTFITNSQDPAIGLHPKPAVLYTTSHPTF